MSHQSLVSQLKKPNDLLQIKKRKKKKHRRRKTCDGCKLTYIAKK